MELENSSHARLLTGVWKEADGGSELRGIEVFKGGEGVQNVFRGGRSSRGGDREELHFEGGDGGQGFGLFGGPLGIKMGQGVFPMSVGRPT